MYQAKLKKKKAEQRENKQTKNNDPFRITRK